MNAVKENVINETKELDYLIKLLDDEDENIYNSVRERFLSHGENTSEYLRGFLNDENILIKKRAGEIISTINYDKIRSELIRLSNSDTDDLLENSMIALTEFAYPSTDKNEIKKVLDEMSADISKKLNFINPDHSRINALQLLNTINDYLFNEKGFGGNSENYFDPDNSYIGKFLEKKTGLPVTLSVVYLLIAKRLNIPVFGINLPGHFILKYIRDTEEYFIDPYNNGIIISLKEASEFIKNAGMTNEDFKNIPYLHPATDKEIILRVIRNLIEVYKKENNTTKSQQLENLTLCFA